MLLVVHGSPIPDQEHRSSSTETRLGYGLDIFSDGHLFAIILEELSLQMDNTVWDVMDVFRHIELNTLTTGSDRESFTGLHNVSKHILFLQESMEAVTLTVKNLSAHHRSILKIVPDRDRHATIMAQAMLTHVETQFQSIGLRLNSLEKRMQNIIALVSSNHFIDPDSGHINKITL
ncbi:hypothetical protein EYZ11_010693 [Aspergillus tanneri]|uniref:Uncharacterized protein n=1 Tax=Aspergillus tanneri TaxID=1220188 RepID=A0A4S3J586_9EURO|nr:hypothetical protein EYZ11_010693 [Aspergillus tanneri]